MSVADVKVSWIEPNKQYRKCVGWYTAPDGRRQKRHFWLGRDERTAKHKADVLGFYWRTYLEPAGQGWTDLHEQRAAQFLAVQQRMVVHAQERVRMLTDMAWAPPPQLAAEPTPLAAAAEPQAPRSPADVATLATATKRFVDSAKARGVGAKYLGRATDAFKQLAEVLPPDSTPLSRLDQQALLGVVGYFTARPVSRRTGEPLAVTSVKTVLGYLRAVLELAEAELGWTAAPAWRRLFKIQWARLYTPAEARALAFGAATFSVEELKHLYATANDRQRLYVLLGLNCGATQTEIATLLRADVDLAAGTITRLRGKTRSTAPTACCWRLWPETLQLLKEQLADENPGGLALLTRDGRPVVDPAKRCDSVTLAWGNLRRACIGKDLKVRPLGFKYLRKTGATWIREHGGEQYQQEYLGHVRGSVAGRHYSGPSGFARMHNLLNQYRRHLHAASVFGGGT